MIDYVHKVSPCVANKQTILAVDDKGNFLEYIPKEVGHTGAGRRHLAITVLLQNSKDQVLLQKRKHKIFDNLWDLTGATHPLHKPHSCHSERSEESLSLSEGLAYARDPSLIAQDDKKCRVCGQDDVDESLEEATKRCLREEWDIRDISDIKILGEFNYFAPYQTVQGDFCENEHCVMMVGEYDGEVNLDQEIGYEYKWMDKADFLKDIASNPKNYTPWAKKAVTSHILL